MLFLIAWSKIVGLDVNPGNGQFVDIVLEQAAVQKFPRDIVEPETLAQVDTEFFGRFHRVISRELNFAALVSPSSSSTDRKSLLALRGVGPESEAESVRFHRRRVTKVGLIFFPDAAKCLASVLPPPPLPTMIMSSFVFIDLSPVTSFRNEPAYRLNTAFQRSPSQRARQANSPLTDRKRIDSNERTPEGVGYWGAMEQKSSIRKMSNDFLENVGCAPQRAQLATTYGFWKRKDVASQD